MTVKMSEPVEADRIKAKIRKKKKRRSEIEAEIKRVEDFIEEIPEGIEKQIFELIYLEGFSQKEAAEAVGYTQSMISKIIKKVVKDS